MCLDDFELIYATSYTGILLDNLLSEYRISKRQMLEILRQVACTLQEMHTAGLTHSDLKYDNICVDWMDWVGWSWRVPSVTLIDLGHAGRPGHVFRGVDFSVSFHYAPEVVTTGTSNLADIYSLGFMIKDIFRVDGGDIIPGSI